MRHILREVTCLRSPRGDGMERTHSPSPSLWPGPQMSYLSQVSASPGSLCLESHAHTFATLTLPPCLSAHLGHPGSHGSSQANPRGAMCGACLWGFGYRCNWAEREQIGFRTSLLAFIPGALGKLLNLCESRFLGSQGCATVPVRRAAWRGDGLTLQTVVPCTDTQEEPAPK